MIPQRMAITAQALPSRQSSTTPFPKTATTVQAVMRDPLCPSHDLVWAD